MMKKSLKNLRNMGIQKTNFNWGGESLKLSERDFLVWLEFDASLLPAMYTKMFSTWGTEHSNHKIYTLSEYEQLLTNYVQGKIYA